MDGKFDTSKPWGLLVENGEIVEARILSSTSEYINIILNMKITSLNSIEWEKVISEFAESFTIEILVASPLNMPSVVSMLGKIAGIPDIDVVNRQTKQEGTHWIREVFHGNAVIQSARLLIFFFISILMLLATALVLSIFDKFKNYIHKIKRRKIVTRSNIYFRSIELDSYYQQLCEIFIDEGRSGLFSLGELMNDQRFRSSTYRFYTGKEIIQEDDLILLLEQIESCEPKCETRSFDMASEFSLRESENFAISEGTLSVQGPSIDHAEGMIIESYLHQGMVASAGVTIFFIAALKNHLIVKGKDGFELPDTMQSLFNHLNTSQKGTGLGLSGVSSPADFEGR